MKKIGVLTILLLFFVASCSSGGGGSSSDSGTAPTLSYSGSAYIFAQNVVITAIVPVLGGGAPTSCTVSPALPAGLTIDDTTCIISGRATTAQAATDYTITAGNAYGSDNTTINITVDGTAPTVSMANLHENSIVETGFLLGAASDNLGVSRVEVSLDSGAWQPANGTTAWSYPLPTGVDTWRADSAHTVAVRSRDSAGLFSNVATIHVRKGNNRDVNGDGYIDVAVGAQSYNTNTGRIYVFYGSNTGIAATSVSGADTIITGEVEDVYFGETLSMGDVNGDGYADLVVGAPRMNSDAGRVYIFRAGSNGISASNASEADSIIDGQSNDEFGSSLSIGDANGDGYSDLFVGSRYSDRAYLFSGSGSGISASDAATDANATITGETTGDFFGAVVY